LPPYITVPHSIDIAGQLAAIDPGILSIKHINEPCYAAFAVLEIASILIMQEMNAVLGLVRELVGEVDFSVHFGGGLDGSGTLVNGWSDSDIDVRRGGQGQHAVAEEGEKGKQD
jgi:hypothetical protein